MLSFYKGCEMTGVVHNHPIAPLCSRSLAIHLLSIPSKDGINAFLLNAKFGQQLFNELVPISNDGFGIGLKGCRSAKDDSLVTERLERRAD